MSCTKVVCAHCIYHYYCRLKYLHCNSYQIFYRSPCKHQPPDPSHCGCRNVARNALKYPVTDFIDGVGVMGCGAASAACCNLIICFPIKIFYFSVLRTEEQLQMHTRIFKEEQRAGNQQLVFTKMQITV